MRYFSIKNRSRYCFSKFIHESSKTTLRTQLEWYNYGIVKINGKVFPNDEAPIDPSKFPIFPTFKGFDLKSAESIFPVEDNFKYKLVGFSLCDYGFTLVRTWLDPFRKIVEVQGKVL